MRKMTGPKKFWYGFWIAITLFFILTPCLSAKEFIDLFCPDVERKEAILTCAFQAGVEVVFLEAVKGRVNLRKDHVRFEEALSMILKGSGVSWFRADGVYYIGLPPSQDALPVASEQFERYDLKYRKSQEVIASLPQYRDILVAHGEYTLLVSGNTMLRRAVLERIKALDIPKTHVLVKALVLECKKGEAKKLGFSFPKNGKGVVAGEVNLGGPFERLETLKAYLKGLAEEENIHLRSEMEVLVLEGEEGEISTTGEVYYPVQGETELQKADVGTTLRVLPRKVNQDEVEMDVAVTVNDLQNTSRSGFSVTKREAQTHLVLKKGTVVSITGLKQEEQEERYRKISHRRTSSRKEKTELIVLLQVDEKSPSISETIASTEYTGDKIVIPEFSRSYEYHLLLYCASLSGTESFSPWLGIGFSGQDSASPWQVEGRVLSNLSGEGKGEITLRYPMEENTYLALRWDRVWGDTSCTIYSLYLGGRGSLAPHLGWHAGLGARLSGSQEVSFVFLKLEGNNRDFSLRAGFLYQWYRQTGNLWLEAEGYIALSKRVNLVLGYRQRLSGRPIEPFDSVFFDGLYAGILFRL